jgi:hypothetical protein
LKYKNF